MPITHTIYNNILHTNTNNHYTLHNYKHINYTHNKLINISTK